MPSDSTIRKNLLKAKAASSLSDFPTHKLGAVMMLGNKVLSVGYNITKTHPIQKTYNIERGYDQNVKNNGQVHAEMMCIINTRYMDVDWSKVSLYIYREHKNHSPAFWQEVAKWKPDYKEKRKWLKDHAALMHIF